MFGFFKKKKEKPYVTAVVAAGGTGTRMGGNKLVIELCGTPVLAHTLMALQKSDYINEIIIAAHSDFVVEYGQIAVDFGITKIKSVIAGGKSRTQSVLNGILEAGENTNFILVHDGARPFVSSMDIEAVCQKAFETGAATGAVPVKDTIKSVRNGKITSTLERSSLMQVQTPQVFDLDLIKGALTKAVQEDAVLTDDCQAMENMGFFPDVVTTSYDNIKITTIEDISVGEGILMKRKGGR